MDFSPITYRLKRVLKGGKQFHYSDVCEKSWIIAPAPSCTQKTRAAIALDGQFDRVTGLSQPGKTFEREWALLSGKWTEMRDTTAYLLKDVSLLHGYLYKGPLKHTLTTSPEKYFVNRVQSFTQEAALGCTYTGNSFYSHWMTDNLTLELAAADLAEPVLCRHRYYEHAVDYRKYFELNAEFFTQAHFEKLILVEDVSQNEYKRQRYEVLRERLKKLGSSRTGHGVMILRGSSGRLRLLANEQEVSEYLAKQGFTIINPQEMSAIEIIRSIQGAKIVVGVEGSTMAHGFFSMADGGTLLMLQPPYRFNALYKEYIDCVGMRFSYVVGHAVPHGFEVDIEELERTLELLWEK